MGIGEVFKRRYLHVSLEDFGQEGTNVERELEAYALISDLNELKNAASIEQQEQYGIVPATGTGHKGSTRIRKTVKAGETTFMHTTKVLLKDGSNLETNKESSEEMFTAFKNLANDGMLKDRFIFPIEGTQLKWEVDVFPQADGSYAPWVKLDLEIPEGMNLQAIPNLPFNSKKTVFKNRKDPSILEFIGKLYDQYFKFKPE